MSVSVVVLLALILHFRLVALADTDSKMNLMKKQNPLAVYNRFPGRPDKS